MKTKLVYVLTCALEDNYVEQALMAVFSARHWNPFAHIVLLTDNLTSELIHDKDSGRGWILEYITEEIVTEFEPDKTMMYRSRWIKTKVRDLVSGDFLFIDCDTICCRPLEDVDGFECEAGAVLESHLQIVELNEQMQARIEEKARIVGWSIKSEAYYFSSGVIYAKDTENVHKLYKCWHNTWKSGVKRGINIDQPSLAKANIDCGHIIKNIPDSYNCILFTQPRNIDKAHILHIAAFRNPSFLFDDATLNYIRHNGLQNEWLKEMILNPCHTIRPFDYEILHSSILQRMRWMVDMSDAESGFVRNIGSDCNQKFLKNEFQSAIWMLRKRLNVIRHRDQIKDNVCRK